MKNIVTLQDVTHRIGDGLHGTPKYDLNGDYFFINGNNLSNGKIEIKSDTKRISSEEYNKIKKDLSERTILLAINGTIGNLGFYNGENVALGKSACYMNIKEDVEIKYIRYVLEHDDFQKYAISFATGATIKNLGLKAVREYKFNLPPLPTQKRIASILSSYDDLIENNSKRIKLLEEIAQRTYEESFVKFRVNGEQLAIDEATGLPVGWTGAPLGDLISFQKGKKASIIVDEYQNGYEKLLLLDGIESGKYPYTNPIGQVIAERNDLIMLMDGARSSKVFFADKGVVGSTLSKIVIKNSYLSSSLLKHFFEINFGWMQTNNTGAAIPHANKKFINSMPFSIPTLDVFINWKTTIDPIYNKIQNLKDQILLLKQSRDILLPRLMSGKINVES
jgi:type I restriction enzyme S subunit